MALTDIAIRNAKPAAKDYKLADTGGLYLLITAAGGKLWRLKFRIDGKERKFALGRYPEISLSEARKRRDTAREQVALGTDPAREKQRAKWPAAGLVVPEIGYFHVSEVHNATKEVQPRVQA